MFSNIYFSRGILDEEDPARRKWAAIDFKAVTERKKEKGLREACVMKHDCVCVVAFGGGGNLSDHAGTYFEATLFGMDPLNLQAILLAASCQPLSSSP